MSEAGIGAVPDGPEGGRPRRRWRLQLTLEADSERVLVGALFDVIDALAAHEVAPGRSFMGGRHCSVDCTLDEDPAVTAAGYVAALEAYLANGVRGGRNHAAPGDPPRGYGE